MIPRTRSSGNSNARRSGCSPVHALGGGDFGCINGGKASRSTRIRFVAPKARKACFSQARELSRLAMRANPSHQGRSRPWACSPRHHGVCPPVCLVRVPLGCSRYHCVCEGGRQYTAYIKNIRIVSNPAIEQCKKVRRHARTDQTNKGYNEDSSYRWVVLLTRN